MFSKFKDNESVIVDGVGEYNNHRYRNKKAVVICRDSYYLDYNVRFEDGTEDWVAEKILKKLEGECEDENNLY